MTITELAESSLVDRAALSRMLSDFEARGIVRKHGSQKDKCYTGIFLTTAGKKLFADVLPYARRQIDYAISNLTDSELNTLKRF